MNKVRELKMILRLTEYVGMGHEESIVWDEMNFTYDVAFDLSESYAGPTALAIVTEFCEGLTGGLL